MVTKVQSKIQFKSKYTADGLEKLLMQMVGDMKLSRCVRPAMIATYEINTHQSLIMSTQDGIVDESHDFLVRHVARATSAAPTYFPPAEMTGPNFKLHCVDGGITLNNPSMAVFSRIHKSAPKDVRYVFVSIGTGVCLHDLNFEEVKNWGLVHWVLPLLDMILDGGSIAVDQQMQMMLPPLDGKKQYYRLQMPLPQTMKQLDNIKAENLHQLEQFATLFLESPTTSAQIDELISQLLSV